MGLPRILAIVVLYKVAPMGSASYCTLLRAREAARGLVELDIVLRDNSPEACALGELPPGVWYVHDGSNSGLANAYNDALTFAVERGYDWLLTLDQDTELPDDALRSWAEILARVGARLDVAAIVPEIHASGKIVSPNWFALGAWPRWFAAGYSGVPEVDVYAFNSGSMVRVAALRQIGGYSPWFWLDNSDAYLYRQLHAHGKRVYVAGELRIAHDFSMMQMQERVSPERYETVLLAESGFWETERNWLAGVERTLRLAGRAVKHVLRRDSAALQRLTWQALRDRIFRSRSYRVNLWREKTRARLGDALRAWRRPVRPMVSVCMAAYGGERFIEEQIRSIAMQMQAGDEIVIVDDASPDGSATVIEKLRNEFGDAPKIVSLRHEKNAGPVASFEDAIRCASGEILFLADDDDVWAADKVSKVMAAFASDAEVQMVVTGLRLMDEEGRPLVDEKLMRHRKFTTDAVANLMHNQFQGSTMAFRAGLIREVLPFPKRKLFLHDAWMGMRAILRKKKIVYIDEPLLLYRRHGRNYSRKHSMLRQAWLRVQMVTALLLRWRQSL